jgi:hypothetical protein
MAAFILKNGKDKHGSLKKKKKNSVFVIYIAIVFKIYFN